VKTVLPPTASSRPEASFLYGTSCRLSIVGDLRGFRDQRHRAFTSRLGKSALCVTRPHKFFVREALKMIEPNVQHAAAGVASRGR
jgi:hypothetical protein